MRTLADLVFHIRDLSAGRPDLLSVRWPEKQETLSASDFLRSIHSVTLALEARGLARGDRVAIYSESRPEWHMVDLACQLLGAVTVPIDPELSTQGVGFILRNSGSRWIFFSDSAKRERLLELRPSLTASIVGVAFDPDATLPQGPSLTHLLGEGATRRGEVPLERFRDRVGEDDLATLLYTSGTTGDPKGVMLSHRNLVSNALACGKTFTLDTEDLAVSFLPLSHGFQRTIDHLCFYRGVAIHYVPHLEDVPSALRTMEPTLLVAVPRVYERARERTFELLADEGWLRRTLFGWAVGVGRSYQEALRSGFIGPLLALERRLAELIAFRWVRQRFGGRLRFALCGGGALDQEVSAFFGAIGIPIDQGYGLAESSPVLATSAPKQRRRGSVGKAVGDVELRVAEDGEILARGPGVMMGYWENPQATAASLSASGWLRTGDVGRIDQSGYLFVTDRKQDLLITTDGQQIAPGPLEQKLTGGVVVRAVVVGDNRPHLAALLVPDFEKLRQELGEFSDAELATHDTVLRRCAEWVQAINEDLPERQKIQRFAVLERDFSVEDGELTTSLKVRRRAIVQRWAERIATLYAST